MPSHDALESVAAIKHETGGFEIIGREGRTLDEKWSTAVRSLHGIYTRGFPNLFIIAGLRQGAPTLNYPHMTDEQAAHAAQIVKRMLQDKVKIMEVAQEAEDRWCELIIEKSKANLQYLRECTPSYLNNEGDLQGVGKLVLATAYGGGAFEYLEILRDWRERHLPEDMQLTRE